MARRGLNGDFVTPIGHRPASSSGEAAAGAHELARVVLAFESVRRARVIAAAAAADRQGWLARVPLPPEAENRRSPVSSEYQYRTPKGAPLEPDR